MSVSASSPMWKYLSKSDEHGEDVVSEHKCVCKNNHKRRWCKNSMSKKERDEKLRKWAFEKMNVREMV